MFTVSSLANSVLAVVFTFGLLGCSSDSSSGGGSMSQAAAQLEAEKTAEQQAEQKTAADAQAAQQSAAAQQAAVEKPRTEAGRGSIGEGGYLVAIAGARRHVLNKVEDLAWTQGVQHFQAEHGRLPKDHAEFMSRIVEPLGIDLGYIEEGQEFLYDPNEGQWGTLYVVQKADAAGPGTPQQ
jgi:hypothetical protein